MRKGGRHRCAHGCCRWCCAPIAPPIALGLVVAPLLIAAESLLVYLLMQVNPGNLFGVVFLLGVVVVSIGWGFRLGTMTALVSALVYAYFHHLQTGGTFIPTELHNWVAVIVFLVVALSATIVAGVARLRAVEADQRRREVEASHDEFRVLAEHQAALRRVATLVARGVTPSELFSAVAEELARCLGVYHHAVLFRYEPDGAGVLLAAGHGDRGLKAIPVGERFSLEGDSVAARVFRTCRAARMVSYENASGPVAARFRDLGLRTAVGAPIIVDGHLWGAAIVGSTKPALLPPRYRGMRRGLHGSGRDRDRERPDPRRTRRARRATGGPAASGDIGRARGTPV
jgi:hypothetical protein